VRHPQPPPPRARLEAPRYPVAGLFYASDRLACPRRRPLADSEMAPLATTMWCSCFAVAQSLARAFFHVGRQLVERLASHSSTPTVSARGKNATVHWLHPLQRMQYVCRSFPKISSALSAKVCGGSRSAKILIRDSIPTSLRPCSRTSFHHQPEAQHPKSSAIHKLPADYPIFRGKSGHAADIAG
jgi:hypothetical protein